MKKILNNKINVLTILTILFFLFFIGMESVAYARAGGGRSLGSRGFGSGGSRSYQRTAPTRPPTTAPTRPPTTAQQPSTQVPPIQQPQPSFGRSLLYGIGGGLMGGMIGSMLFGSRGYAGGGGYGGGFGFGDFIILLVIAGIIYFIYKKYRARKAEEMQMNMSGVGYSSSYNYNESIPAQTYNEQTFQNDPVSNGLRHIKEMDVSFDENQFRELAEDTFFKIQGGWTRRDMSNVKSLLTPQMLSTFQADIDNYISNKQINRLENIAMRQVDIVDAVQDQGEEYITVIFLASILDYTVSETDNRVISGSQNDPVKFLEYWTFTRKTGNKNWLLAGITQETDY
ncbi:MAG: Tim44 domain-containing protein [Syntrophorhabdaceae bacterium]|nr:Tim44 domain-containing protein [Syntrophorhabdaceae bacterium]